MSKKAMLYTGFFVALIIIFYLIVSPWIKRNDTISAVQPFSFINQDGKLVTDKDVEEKCMWLNIFLQPAPVFALR